MREATKCVHVYLAEDERKSRERKGDMGKHIHNTKDRETIEG